MQSKKKELLQKINMYKKKLNEIDINMSRYLSNKQKYPHPGHESFISEVRRFENSIYAYPDKDIRYMLDNLMSSIRIYEKIWRQQTLNIETKQKNPFSEKEIKKIYSSYLSIKKTHGGKYLKNFEEFKQSFNKNVEAKLKNIKSDEKLNLVYSEKTGDILIKTEQK